MAVLQSQIPVAEQRLIYKGRVLKDEQTVEALGACVCREVSLSERWKEAWHVRGASGASVSAITTALVHGISSAVRTAESTRKGNRVRAW